MPVNVQKAAEEYERLKNAEFDGSITYLKLEEGPNVIRILPPFGQKDKAWITVKKSFGIGPNGKSCSPRYDSTCPLKIEIDRLSSTGNEDDKKRATGMMPKNRTQLWVVPRARHKQAGEGPILFDTNNQVFRQILSIFADPDYGDISDPINGTDFTIHYTPKEKTANGFPAWQVTPKRHPSHLGTPEEIAAWTSEDLFEKYSLGKPSEDGWILACLAGTEERYLEEMKKGSGSTSATPTDVQQNTQVSSPPAAAVPPPAAPPTPAAPPAAKKLVVPDPAASYWAVDPTTQTTVQMTAAQVGAYFEAGHDLTTMTLDQSSGWSTASKLGFAMVADTPVPPAAPAPPPGPPAAPPPPSFNSGDSDAALRAKIEQLRQAKANGGTSQVAADVKAQLGA